ncbi:hypothetical protein ILYODFUR_021887 [Ilyodon furcidens]|uniref:Uncharacterized protein n=1 Tax=Ilyodon furcidens TaxID=33524 RepID=A0ABV0T0F9_9TELE
MCFPFSAPCGWRLVAVAEGRFKGFGKFNVVHDHNQGAVFEELWFTQKLDHFNGADSRVWKQRYFVNETFYKPGGPVFLMIGGEGPANPAWMKEGTWLTYAEKLGALCFMLEHRFYGKSHPTAYVCYCCICMMVNDEVV